MEKVTFNTEREFLTAVINAKVSDAITEFAESRIAALDRKNEKRKTSKSALEHKATNDSFKTAILSALSDNKVWTANMLAATLSTAENTVSTQKVSALARQLADSGEVKVYECKIKGKGKCKGYALPTAEVETTD